MLDPVEYGFESMAEAPPLGDAFALIREAEGVTMITAGTGWARIMLSVHSSLDAVGMTAAVSEALTAAGICCEYRRRLSSRSCLRAVEPAR